MTVPIWTPSVERVKSSNMSRYQNWLKKEKGLSFSSYEELHRWSVSQIPDFWESIWKFSDVKFSKPYDRVMGEPKMPGTRWFEGTRLNFAENLLRYRDQKIALLSYGEGKAPRQITYEQLYQEVAKVSASLKKIGIKPGDRIVGYLPNIPETVIAMLATTSLGAVWSSCSPDFGVQGVLDRFGQIEPKALFTVDGYFYNGKQHSILDRLQEIVKNLPTLKKVVIVPYADPNTDCRGVSRYAPTEKWTDFLTTEPVSEIPFAQLPFDHPLYIMYSSGTTGAPKCIVHGIGGTLLQHLKELVLHSDLKREDRIFFFTTCGWMMWNWLVSSLAVGATVVLYEGSPSFPNLNILWEIASREKVTHFGTSPKFLAACEKGGISPGQSRGGVTPPLQNLRTILSTGSPLSVENFKWVYRNIKSDLHLASISGGTDIIGCFMLGNPNLPVYPGEIQCRGLGMRVECWDESGKPVVGQQGELVCTAPFPSMPIYFWKDPEGKKYHDAYFDVYPNVWRHGDFIEITSHGGIIIYGRSDATLNPGGVRIGTAEIYRQVESIPEVVDSLVVGQRWENDVRVILFVVLKKELTLNEPLIRKIRETIRAGTTPRHVPSKIIQVNEIPYTVSGKKVELAVTRLIHNEPVKNQNALANPDSLRQFENLRELQKG
ncbi:MAG: acetoacetate--CoA ligase [Deltaproteobacteria bacterium]|nr:acetoacetate--CoA ligase [Deltaproteobacteria bacterium]